MAKNSTTAGQHVSQGGPAEQAVLKAATFSGCRLPAMHYVPCTAWGQFKKSISEISCNHMEVSENIKKNQKPKSFISIFHKFFKCSKIIFTKCI
ncbi:hypothetical protein [Komagataeibacter diospyri]|uniref:hypothetical protein n=1 Tax=Komagataeibacter diospyri TaxID=1932662 RepID=UPI00114156B0|nr:hypothetical protein [Komagataeibacter diospyri]